jgi:DNA repair protein RadC
VVKKCLKYASAAVIFAHNHPSGIAEPSQADIAITAKLKAALATIDVRVLDHLIIGDSNITSLAERGLL